MTNVIGAGLGRNLSGGLSGGVGLRWGLSWKCREQDGYTVTGAGGHVCPLVPLRPYQGGGAPGASGGLSALPSWSCPTSLPWYGEALPLRCGSSKFSVSGLARRVWLLAG